MDNKQKLLNFMEANGILQTEVAKAIGVSKAAVSKYLAGKYEADDSGIEQRINDYLAREQIKLANKKLEPVYTETPTAKRIRQFLEMAHQNCESVVLHGGAGLGKTTALQQYAQRFPEVVFIQTLTTYTPGVLLKAIAKKIGIEPRGSLNDLNEAVIAKLAGSERLIIVDEAENLSVKSLEVLRRIHDQAGVGLVLAGMHRLRMNLMGRRGELAQLYSRIGFELDLGLRLADNELMQIAQTALFAHEDVLAYMVQEANGNPRRLFKLMFNAARISKINAAPIDKEMVKQVAGVLIKN